MSEDSRDTEAPAEAGAQPAEPPRVAPRRRASGLGRVLFRLMGLAVLVAAGYATFPLWWPHLAPHVDPYMPDMAFETEDPRVEPLRDRVAVLEDLAKARAVEGDVIDDLEEKRRAIQGDLNTLVDRMERLEGAVASVRNMVDATTLEGGRTDARAALERLAGRLDRLEAGTDDVATLRQRIKELEARVAAGTAGDDKRVAQLGLAETIADIARRVGALEDEERGPRADNRAQTVVLAVGQLREAVRDGRPFTQELEALTAVAPDDPAIDRAVRVLGPEAAAGIPGRKTLHGRFDDVVVAVAAAAGGTAPAGEAPDAGDDDWVAETVQNLQSLVTVKRDTAAAGLPPTGRVGTALAEAQDAMKRDEPGAAADALERLSGPAKAAAADWIRAARLHESAAAALADLHAFALGMLAPTGAVADTDGTGE